MATGEVKLSAEELLVALPYFAACDAQAEGFRLGMEKAKQMFVQYLIKQRKSPPQEAERNNAIAARTS